MKIGWLVWTDEFTRRPELYTEEPPSWVYKAVQIVYGEVQE